MQLISSLFALICSVCLLIVGNAFLMTLLGTRLSLDAVDPFQIGGIMVCYSVGFVLGTLYCDRVIKRVGHIRAFAAFCALLAISALCYPIKFDGLLWAVLRMIGGLGMAGLLLVVESWFTSIARNDNRATLFSIYTISIYLSVSIGQVLVSLGDPNAFMLYSLAAGLLIAALIPLSLTRMQAPSIEHVEPLSLKKAFAASPLGLLSALVSGIVISAFYSVGPLYATLIGFSIAQLAQFMAVSVLAAVVFAWPIGWACDRVDRAWLLAVVVAFTAVIAAILLFASGTGAWMITIGCALFMGVVASIYPIGVAITTDRLSSHQMVSASATMLLCYGIGSCVGPLLGAGMIQWFGAYGMFIGNASVLSLLLIYTVYRMGRGRTVSVENQEHYIPMTPIATPVIHEMDPRNPDFVETPEDILQPVESS